MVNIRNLNEIILNLIDYYRLVQPDLDVKTGTVARDLFIDGPSGQLALLYDELSLSSTQQSLRLIGGNDLDNFARNFGVVRKKPTPSTGVALLTFSSINATVPINAGSIIYASNGFSFSVVSGVVVKPESANLYKSVATQFKNDLDFVGITDQYAVQVNVQATSAGTSGNIGKYSLNKVSIPGVSNVTNTAAFTGGSNQESDALFRDRVLAVFSGSSVGTSLGYKNAALSTSGVNDAIVIEAGDPLMTRDGTISQINADGTATVLSEGSGGKVDVIVLGSSLQETIDSFIYRDKSNNNDPTNDKNNVILGQISGDENKTIAKRRRDNVKSGTLPTQPVQEVLEVSGSLSGTNFKEKSIDQYGRVSGNYEIIKDTGLYQGSPWGSDAIKWVSDRVSLFEEDRIKGQYNGQDQLTFKDLLEIPFAEQNIQITNENSKITSDRSIIQLLHSPVSNISRVFNTNTGERYLVVDQNPDGTGTLNTSGRIKISGNTLPTTNDVLQVDYIWTINYDRFIDYDGLKNTYNLRTVNDSIDWGYSSLVKNEKIKLTKDIASGIYSGKSVHPPTSIINVSKYFEVRGTVQKITSGVYSDRLNVVITNLADEVLSVNSGKLKNTQTEVFDTASKDGLFINSVVVVGLDLLNKSQIILPTDTVAKEGDVIVFSLNETDVFYNDASIGSFSSNIITIPAANFSDTDPAELYCKINYIADTSELMSPSINSFPISRVGNGYLTNTISGFTNNYSHNTLRHDNLVVQKDIYNNYYIEFTLLATDYVLSSGDVISVVRIVDGKELHNFYNLGSMAVVNNKYQLTLNGLNSPQTGDRVIAMYYATDSVRSQPFTYQNKILRQNIKTALLDYSSNLFYIPIDEFISESSISYSILDAATLNVEYSNNDGYIPADFETTANLHVDGYVFTAFNDLYSKKILISGAVNPENNGTFDIYSYDKDTGYLVIGSGLEHINKNQVSVIRLMDNKEIWSDTANIDYANNRLYLKNTTQINAGDKLIVSYFNFNNVKQTPTKLSINLSDQVANSGTLSIYGNTMVKADGVVFTATASGLKISLNEVVRKALGLSSISSIPSNVKLIKISSLDRVSTVSSSSDEVLQTLGSYDILYSRIKNISYYSNELIQNEALSDLELELPSTINNTLNSANDRNLIKVGDKLKITCYFLIEGDVETLNYTRNGVLYTNKNFVSIDKVLASSGFKSSQSSKFIFAQFNQPALNARYKVKYDYAAPKQNERIVVRYTYNKVIGDTTFNIENTRPINADVLVKAANSILIDLTMNVVISSDYLNSSTLVVQNLKDKLISSITSSTLAPTLDASDLINAAYTINGIDRARVIYFNKNGETGSVLSIIGQKNEYFVANNVIVNIETR